MAEWEARGTEALAQRAEALSNLAKGRRSEAEAVIDHAVASKASQDAADRFEQLMITLDASRCLIHAPAMPIAQVPDFEGCNADAGIEWLMCCVTFLGTVGITLYARGC
jgi:hypothetical protein